MSRRPQSVLPAAAIASLALPLALAALVPGCGSDASRDGRSGDALRLPARQADAIRQIRLAGGRLAWGNVVVGSTLREVEREAGERIEPPRSEGELCPTYRGEATVLGQRLELELTGSSETSRVVAIGVELPGGIDPRAAAAALEQRLPGLEWVPSRHGPELPKHLVERPMYRLGPEQRVWIDPRFGVWIGDPCVD